jgi:hypothetical protein
MTSPGPVCSGGWFDIHRRSEIDGWSESRWNKTERRGPGEANPSSPSACQPVVRAVAATELPCWPQSCWCVTGRGTERAPASSATTPQVCLPELTCEEIQSGTCKAESDGRIIVLLQLHKRKNGHVTSAHSRSRTWWVVSNELPYLNIIQKLPFYVKDETRYIIIPRLINQKNTGSNPKNIFI